jgi:hypothetical protein
MNATPSRHSNKNQWQGAQADPKHKQDRAQGRVRTGLSLNDKYKVNKYIDIFGRYQC